MNDRWSNLYDDFHKLNNKYALFQLNNIKYYFTSAGLVSTLAGNGAGGSSNGLGTNAGFNYPHGISSPDSNGNIYVADTSNNLIRKIDR